jgi:NADPH-dependent F420 reductase
MSEEKVAIIGGTGDLGYGLALRWAGVGVSVVIGSREAAKAEAAAGKVLARLGELSPARRAGLGSVTGAENGQAAAQAAVVVLSVPFPAQVAILKSIRAALGAAKDAILVDATVPLAATLGGKPTRMLSVWQGSAAEQARELVPSSVPVLAALHNASAEALEDLSLPLDCDILICGDDAEAKKRFFPLVERIEGLRPIDAGPLEMARIVESMTALLISLNRQYKVHHAGVRITGLDSGAHGK